MKAIGALMALAFVLGDVVGVLFTYEDARSNGRRAGYTAAVDSVRAVAAADSDLWIAKRMSWANDSIGVVARLGVASDGNIYWPGNVDERPACCRPRNDTLTEGGR